MVQMPTLDEVAALREALAEAVRLQADAARRNVALTGELRVVRTERDLLQEKLNKLTRRLFAPQSEAGVVPQKDLFFNEAEDLAASTEPAAEEPADGDKSTTVASHTRKAKRGRKPLDPALPRKVVRHELPEDQRVCPHDGSALREIGVETSEQFDIIPQQVRVLRHERVKYACPCCDGAIRLAARPAQIIPRGLFTESALAWIATSKYLDGLPLYRQAALLGRFGGTDISRNTVAASIVRVGQAVQPVINLLRDELLDAPLVFGDETELQVLKEPGRSAQAKSFIWAQMTDGSGMSGTGPPIRLFAYSPSRSTKTARELYAGMRQGAVFMSDGYDVYDAIAIEHKLVHLGCWTHCRRYFNDALQALPKDKRGPERLPARFIALIGKLYHIEAQARRDEVDVDELGRRRRVARSSDTGWPGNRVRQPGRARGGDGVPRSLPAVARPRPAARKLDNLRDGLGRLPRHLHRSMRILRGCDLAPDQPRGASLEQRTAADAAAGAGARTPHPRCQYRARQPGRTRR